MIDKGCLKNTIPLRFKEHPNWKMLVYIYLCLPQSLSKKIAYTQYTPWKFNYIIYITDTKMRLLYNRYSFEIWSFLSIQAKFSVLFTVQKHTAKPFPACLGQSAEARPPCSPCNFHHLSWPHNDIHGNPRAEQRSTPPKTNMDTENEMVWKR